MLQRVDVNVNRGAFARLADEVEKYDEYNWYDVRNCAMGVAREVWGQPNELFLPLNIPARNEPALIALGITKHQALSLFFNSTHSRKDDMVGNLRKVAAGGDIELISLSAPNIFQRIGNKVTGLVEKVMDNFMTYYYRLG